MSHIEKTILYILTAVYRDENLGKLAVSIRQLDEFFQVIWLPIMNTGAGNWHAGGKYNLGLDIIETCKEPGWVYMLDDDNLIHKDFGPALAKEKLEPSVLFFPQLKSDGSYWLHKPCLIPCCVDTGSFVVHSDLLKNPRWMLTDGPEYDFGFINRVCIMNKVDPKFVSTGNTLYNAITGIGTVGHGPIPPEVISAQLAKEREMYPLCR